MSDSRIVSACPHCDSTKNVYRRTDRPSRDRIDDGEGYDWYCCECGQASEELNERPTRGNDGWSADAILENTARIIRERNGGGDG